MALAVEESSLEASAIAVSCAPLELSLPLQIAIHEIPSKHISVIISQRPFSLDYVHHLDRIIAKRASVLAHVGKGNNCLVKVLSFEFYRVTFFLGLYIYLARNAFAPLPLYHHLLVAKGKGAVAIDFAIFKGPLHSQLLGEQRCPSNPIRNSLLHCSFVQVLIGEVYQAHVFSVRQRKEPILNSFVKPGFLDLAPVFFFLLFGEAQ